MEKKRQSKAVTDPVFKLMATTGCSKAEAIATLAKPVEKPKPDEKPKE